MILLYLSSILSLNFLLLCFSAQLYAQNDSNRWSYDFVSRYEGPSTHDVSPVDRAAEASDTNKVSIIQGDVLSGMADFWINGQTPVQPAAGMKVTNVPFYSAGSSRPYTGLIASLLPLFPRLSGRHVDAVIQVESHYNPRAVSNKGAVGLMQVMPRTAATFGSFDLFDPRQNLQAGMQYLDQLMLQFGSFPLALAAYNAGPAAVMRYHGIPPFLETQKYVVRVMQKFAVSTP